MALIQTEMNVVNSGGTSDVIVPNAIANNDGTSSGWGNSTNLGLHITNGGVANNHSPIVEVKTLITNSTINKKMPNNVEVTDTMDFNFTTDDNIPITIPQGSIIEVVSSLSSTPIRIIYKRDGYKETGSYNEIYKVDIKDKWVNLTSCLDVYVYANKISFGVIKLMSESESPVITFSPSTVYGVFLITNKIETTIRNLQNN